MIEILNLRLGDYGSLSSIFSLLLSAVIYWNVRKLSRKFLSTARLPELTKDLENLASKVSYSLNDFQNQKSEISATLAQVEASLKSLSEKTNGSLKKTIKNSKRKVVQARDSSELQEDDVRCIYDDLIGLVSELINFERDRAWGTTNG